MQEVQFQQVVIYHTIQPLVLFHTQNLQCMQTQMQEEPISVTDSGGDGSLAYNSSTGVITYTGLSASEVRDLFKCWNWCIIFRWCI